MSDVKEIGEDKLTTAVLSEKVDDRHQHWINKRQELEDERFGKLTEQQLREGKISQIDYILPYFVFGLKATGLYRKGIKNARDIYIREHELYFDNLPPAFDGYRIAHLTDLHLDSLPGIEDTISECLDALQFDVSVFTGDYRWHAYGEYDERVIDPLNRIFHMAQAEDGVYVTLGNHDTHQIAKYLEKMPVTLLNNESIPISRDGESITLTGTDDPHYYLTEDAIQSLYNAEGDFKIALIHSPELYETAADAGHHLYLCGHTHAGQVCLPNGLPVIRNLSQGKHLVSGLWEYRGMKGYTSAGCGVSGAPVRFFSRGEITLFTLRKKS